MIIIAETRKMKCQKLKKKIWKPYKIWIRQHFQKPRTTFFPLASFFIPTEFHKILTETVGRDTFSKFRRLFALKFDKFKNLKIWPQHYLPFIELLKYVKVRFGFTKNWRSKFHLSNCWRTDGRTDGRTDARRPDLISSADHISGAKKVQ